MATCKACGEEVEELVTVKVAGKSRRVCDDCAERSKEQQTIAEESEAAVQQMMGYKGRRA
jgi:ribosome-binding protein aMBF1 (putative translation factor)